MVGAGELVQDVRGSVGSADFHQKAAKLQNKLAGVVKDSKTRFDEPWGMVCLYVAAGAPQTAYAKIVAPKLTLEEGKQPVLAVGAMAANKGSGS